MLKLTNEARGRLLALRRGPGYEDLVDLLARLCEESERNLLKLDLANGATAQQVLNAQNQCRAQRLFMENALAEIEKQSDRLVEDQAKSGAPPKAAAIGGLEPALDLQDAAEILGLIPAREG